MLPTFRSLLRPLPHQGTRADHGRGLCSHSGAILRGWHLVREILINQGQPELALHVSRFGEAMAPPLTEKEQRAAGILEHARERQISERPPASR